MVVWGENLYLANMQVNGFYQVSMQDAQPGDVIIRQPFPGADPCHSMILLHDNRCFTMTMPDTSADENKCDRHTSSRRIQSGDTNSAHL